MSASKEAAPAVSSSAPAKAGHRTGVWVGLGIGVIGLIIVAAVIGSMPSGTPAQTPPAGNGSGTEVNITNVNWLFSGPSYCWSSETGPSVSVTGGSSFIVSETLSYQASGSNPTSCTVETENVETQGFALLGVNTPLTIASGSSATLEVELRAPQANLTTALTLSGSVTAGIPTTTVNVTAVNWDFTGASNCWGTTSGKGTVTSGGSDFTVTILLSYTAGLLDPPSCTVQSVSIGTSGFTLEGSNAPVIVDSGGSQTLSVTVLAPSQTETVVVTIDAQVTSP